MKLTNYITLLSITALTLSAPALAKTFDKRWFEIEVILFSQLGDKSKISEDFSETSPLPKYRSVIDLLSPYLYPDVQPLKQHLPLCDDINADNVSNKPAFSLVTDIFPIKTQDELNTELAFISAQTLTDESLSTLSAIPNDNDVAKNTENDGDNRNDDNNDNNKNSEVFTNHQASTVNNLTNVETTEQLSEAQLLEQHLAQLALENTLLEIEEKFGDKPYQYQPVIFPEHLCQLSEQTLLALQQADANFNENAFELPITPKLINAAETPLSKKPYLISADSLQLHEMVKELRRSKEFRPLLHLGWRQSNMALNKKYSTPIRLFAGENLKANFEKQLNTYQQALANQQIDLAPAETQPQTQLIIEQLERLPAEPDDIIELVKAAQHKNTNKDTIAPPIEPELDWQIEGLFNIHLNHYLYITADFNVADSTLAQNAHKALIKGEPQPIHKIRFSQNKRVISKEIHYFDHPYMGMIVQIRRHTPMQAPVEEQ